jgi:protein PhnA
MSTLPPCPQCNSEFTYEDAGQFVCPECGHEWKTVATTEGNEKRIYRDAAGNELQDGDAVTVIKDLKLKGSGGRLKWAPRSKTFVWSTAITISIVRLMVLAP